MTKLYDFHKNAKVEVTETQDKKGRKLASIIVDDQYEHTFGRNSRITKALDIMTPELLAERMTNGNYFFVNENLYDFREGDYKGFIQTDETISELVDLLGIHDVANSKELRVHENVTSKKIKLGRKWSTSPIIIDSFKDGGEFKNELHYGWSPFMKTINSAFKLERLVCANGMRGMRTFLNSKIPVVNRWAEHLDIASAQLQNKVGAIVSRRMVEMSKERASVAELMALTNHASERASVDRPESLGMLRNIQDIANPQRYLGDVYQSHLFHKGSPAAAQYPGHLTTLDAYNIATEIRSHSAPVDSSTTRALDLIANDLVFNHKNIILPTSGVVSRKKCSFSDPDAAFFGAMS